MKKAITLTFDNGPTTAVTPHVLDVLAQHRILTTFFVLGQNLVDMAARALIAEASASGHWIGNHTYNHLVPLGLSDSATAAEEEIGRTQDLIGAAAHSDKFFRPFGGGGVIGPHLLSPAAVHYLQVNAYTCVLWNAVPHDWDDPDGWVETAMAQVHSTAWPLIVLHDYDTGAMRHLSNFIRQCIDEGFFFRQDFPPDCMPIVRGKPVMPLDHLTANPARAD